VPAPALLEGIDSRVVRTHDHGAGHTVYQQAVSGVHQLEQVLYLRHGRDPHLPGEQGRV